jgi:hypothetical protein
MDIHITRGHDITNEYGKISKLEMPNKSKIYVTKKGWTLVTPDKKEVLLPYVEINAAIQETIAQGYYNA